jgi:integrating conjugative element membrane protein (TIGR03747 family)
MTDAARTVQRQQSQQQGLILGLVTLPFQIFGVLCGSLLLSLLIECVGMHFFWPAESWHHAEGMLADELSQIPENFTQSIVIPTPGHTAQHLIAQGHDWVFVRSGLLEWIQKTSASARAPSHESKRDFRYYISRVFVWLEDDLIAAAFVALVFAVRLLVLVLALPLFLMAAFVGLLDGLVRRDIRRFGAARESGFLYHRARAALMPLAVLPWVTYLALPVSVHPLLILLPGAVLLGLAVDIAAGSFKKYL